MKHIKQTIIASLLVLSCVFTTGVLTTQPAYAKDDGGLKCAVLPQSLCNKAGDKDKSGHSAIWSLLLLILNIMTAGVGVAAVIGIIIAALMYSSAEDKSDQVSKAKTMIFNTVLGLIAYLLMYAFLQFIIPGGVFS